MVSVTRFCRSIPTIDNLSIEERVQGDARSPAEALVCPHSIPFFPSGPPQAVGERYLKSYAGYILYYEHDVLVAMQSVPVST